MHRPQVRRTVRIPELTCRCDKKLICKCAQKSGCQRNKTEKNGRTQKTDHYISRHHHGNCNGSIDKAVIQKVHSKGSCHGAEKFRNRHSISGCHCRKQEAAKQIGCCRDQYPIPVLNRKQHFSPHRDTMVKIDLFLIVKIGERRHSYNHRSHQE